MVWKGENMKTLIAIPCMDMMHTMFVRSLLGMGIVGECEITFSMSSLVYDARNTLALKAINEKFDRVLWLDSDMTFRPDLFTKLSEHLDNGLEFVSGLYMTRKPKYKPCLFKSIGPGKADFMLEYPKDQLFEIVGCGFGCVMMTTDLIREVGDKFGYPFSPLMGIGEDLTFCHYVGKLGKKLYCDSRLKLGHVGFMEITEETFLKG